MQTNILKKSRCLTCLKTNGHIDIMGSAEAAQHQDHYPEHHVQVVPDEETTAEIKTFRKLAHALVIPKRQQLGGSTNAYVTSDLYESFLEARTSFPIEDCEIIWPATHDCDGFYTVPE